MTVVSLSDANIHGEMGGCWQYANPLLVTILVAFFMPIFDLLELFSSYYSLILLGHFVVDLKISHYHLG